MRRWRIIKQTYADGHVDYIIERKRWWWPWWVAYTHFGHFGNEVQLLFDDEEEAIVRIRSIIDKERSRTVTSCDVVMELTDEEVMKHDTK